MKNIERFSAIALISLCAIVLSNSFAINPIVQTCFSTDPAPMVHNDTLYVYTGHDENGADFFWMQEWRVYSTTDMVNWTDHGSPLAIEDFSWGDDRAWAPQCVERDGKFYLYVPLHSKLTGAMAIGVAVGDSPVGPFKDAIGKPLVDGDWAYIDPTVFIDDDGQAYLFWGNPEIFYVKLNKDMVSFEGEVQKVKQTPEGFGKPKFVPMEADKKYNSTYTEGPWFFKRGGKYYLIYAAGGIPEHIAYSMSDNPTGPWKYMGTIMPQCDTGSFTNHSGVVDFKGKSYFFYHSGKLPGGGGFGRSICVEPFEYNADGTIPTIMPTDTGAPSISTFNPYGRNEAETMSWSKGVSTEPNSATGVYVSDIHNGDFTQLSGVDLGEAQPRKLGVSVASALRGGTIEVRLDSLGGPIFATINVTGTGGWENWKYLETSTDANAKGVHDLYFLFKGRKGPKLFNFDYWILNKDRKKDELAFNMPDSNFHIYLCIGQSNMEGNAPIEDEDRAGVSERFKTMAAVNLKNPERRIGEWGIAVPPLAREHTGLTPADYFGRKMVESLPENVNVGVIMVAIGGCKIEHLMKDYDPSSVTTEADWFKGYMKEYDNTPYNRLLECALKAKREGVIKGILLHQGESNNGDKEWPVKVKKLYDNLLADLGMAPNSIPLIAGEVVSSKQGGVCGGMNEIIDLLPQVLPQARIVSSEGLSQKGDGLHFTAPAYRTLGTRYAETMLEAMKRI